MAARNEATTLSLDRYTPEAKALVASAQALADERRHVEVQPLHLLARALERDPGVAEVLRRAGVNTVEVLAAGERALSALPGSNEPAYLSSAMLDLLERAQREAERDRSRHVAIEHLLNALTQEIRGPAGEILGAFGVAPGSLRRHMAALNSVARPEAPRATAASDYTRDLVSEARRGAFGPVIGRQAEIRRLLTILERHQKSHPLLVGEPGVGKGAVIAAVAKRVARGDVPTSLSEVTLLELEVGALVAGARLRGEIEERVRKLLLSVTGRERQVILVVRNLEQLFGAGPSGSQLGELLGPALLRGQIRMLGATTPDGIRKLQERDAAVLRLFTVLPLEEPSVDQAIEITRGIAQRFEAHHGVEISEDAIVAAVRLAKRYVQERFLPDKAIDLLDEAASAKRVETDGVPGDVDRALARLESLKAQIHSLEHSSDRASVEALERLRKEAAEVEPQVAQMRTRLDARRGAVAELRSATQELDTARRALSAARGEKNFAKVGELEHATIPELERRKAAAEQRAQTSGVSDSGRTLTAEDVASTLAIWTGIPVARMLEGEAEKLLRMEQRLEERVVGQDDAVAAVARAVRRGRVGLRDPGKPIGSFLFLGPSGVGKTELAKALAEFLFDDEQSLTRMDMSEFMSGTWRNA